MTRFWRLCLFLALIIFSNEISAEKLNFYTGSLTSAKEKAAQEGKLYFVDFVASWCTPCLWMDETTYTDPSLIRYIDQSYVPVKVDIDDFDGIVWKQKYNIRVLPSILIFNSKGELLEQVEESLSPSKMLKILQQHDIPANRTRSAASSPTTTPTPNKPGGISRPSLPTKPTTTTAPRPSTKPSAPQPAAPIASGDGLYRFSVSREASSGFAVQIGAFAEYENVLREVAKLQNAFNEPILVHIAKLRGKTVYKVLIGSFKNKDKAMQYQGKMKAKGVNGIIKDLSTMI